MKNNNKHGFTLIELMVTIAIAGIMASMGIPSLQKTIKNNAMASFHNEILSALSFARSEAIKQGTWVAVCKSNPEGDQCEGAEAGWQAGWLIFPDRNNNGTIDVGEGILTVKKQMPEQLSMVYSRNNNRISYGSQGYSIGYNGNITLCDSRSDASKSGMIISNNGRARVADSTDNLLNCPSL